MKSIVDVFFKSYREGETKNGKKWHSINVMDEDWNNFQFFGAKAEEYKDKKVGDKLANVEIEIVPSFNSLTKRYDNVIRLI